MALKKMTGTVTMLGNSTASKSRNNCRTYSLIEMQDGALIRNMKVSDGIDNFLARALKESGEATLWLHESRPFGLTFGGKTYLDMSDYTSPVSNYLMLIVAIPFCLILIGFIFVFAAINAIGKTKARDEILAMNPDAITV